jgi:hypothetical protein
MFKVDVCLAIQSLMCGKARGSCRGDNFEAGGIYAREGLQYTSKSLKAQSRMFW